MTTSTGPLGSILDCPACFWQETKKQSAVATATMQVAGERRLPACSSRQLAANSSRGTFLRRCRRMDNFYESRRASCPPEQAGSLCSPVADQAAASEKQNDQ